MSMPITEAAGIPVSRPTAVATYSPVVLEVPGRAVHLELKVSAPASGSELPIILLSHGHGSATFLSSLHGYGPLADFWAAHGFVVLQPTHLDSGTVGLRQAHDPDAPLYWRTRVEDMRSILDRLDQIEAAVPGLVGRLDRNRIAAVGHSLGGLTTAMLLGARLADPDDGAEVDLTDARVKAGVILAGPGSGKDLAAWASENYPVMRSVDYSTMSAPALVVAGDRDLNPNFSPRVAYRSDAYTSSPGRKSLLTMFGAEHILGGVSGYDAAETTDENPERVATLRALAWAYLRSTLSPGDPAWTAAVTALDRQPEPIGRVESKGPVVVASNFGGPEVLSVVDQETRRPEPHEVVIAVRAAAVNPIDYKSYSGLFGQDPTQLPIRLGREAAGVVIAVGSNATGPAGPIEVGDEVIAFPIEGAYAAEVVVPDNSVVPKPANLPWDEAAGLLLAGTTAVHALTATSLTSGDTVLIHGASGGVGLIAVQLAAHRGARVIATASPRNHDALRHLGAEPVAYGDGLADRVRTLAPAGVTAALDLVGTDEAIDVSLQLVADRSRIATIAGFQRGFAEGLKVLGGAPGADAGQDVRDAARHQLTSLAQEGELQLTVSSTYPLDQVADAHLEVMSGHTFGKIVLTL